ncbi:aquaporin-like [Chironomus tepperi]|uniref:aquaporin-like n=1 Tax=Chironomus tepperi TaxID=113505 RepID=UPI00391F737D
MISEKFVRLGRIFIAETIGTGILLFINCLGCVDNLENYKPSIISASFVAGIALMVSINSFATISGAHVNPAVTLGALIFGMISCADAILFVISQLLGSVFGHAVVRFLISSDYLSNPESFCVNSSHLDGGKAVIIEFIITFIMMCVVCAVWDPKNERFQDSASLRIGLTVSVLVLIAGNFSGGCMNPARSFGPAFYNSNWKNHWVYWVGPMSGSFAASILFKKFSLNPKSIKEVKTLLA